MRRVVSVILASSLLLAAIMGGSLSTSAESPANEHFQETWERTDRPIADDIASRTWMWGPEAFTGAVQEAYAQSPGGERTVQYFDKARMEITNPADDQTSIWYVTNGLLVVELITGEMQAGDNEFSERSPAEVNVAGDATDPDGPTYASFGDVLDAAPADVGSIVGTQIDRGGATSQFPDAGEYGVSVALVDEVTNHAIASQFWDFMNSSAVVYEDGDYINADLFENPYFATGRPITEPYWAHVQVGGIPTDVLVQCFERRCLTYTPDNDPGWQVEAGNVGRHYYEWRYGDNNATPSPTPPPSDPACEPGSGEDFSGEVMLSPSFVGQDLKCADFSGSNMASPDFTDANVSRGVFDGFDTRIESPVFHNTNLTESLFRSTRITNAEFHGTIAVDADFSDARMTSPDFDGANLTGVRFQDARLTQPVFADTDLTGADFSGAEIVDPTFSNSTCPDGSNSGSNGGACAGISASE